MSRRDWILVVGDVVLVLLALTALTLTLIVLAGTVTSWTAPTVHEIAITAGLAAVVALSTYLTRRSPR